MFEVQTIYTDNGIQNDKHMGQNQARTDRRNNARTLSQGESDLSQEGKKIQAKSAAVGKIISCIPNQLRATAEHSSLYSM